MAITKHAARPTLIAICLLSASIAAHGDDKPTTAGRDEIGLREISGEARMAFPPALRSLAGDGAFILDLGECGSLAQSPHMFALRELPHDNSIAVGFCWFDGKGFSKRGVSLERDLGIEAWKLEWKSRGRDATCVAESIAKVGSLLIQDADAPWITRPDEVYELTLTATKVPGALPKTGAIDGGTVHLILTGAKGESCPIRVQRENALLNMDGSRAKTCV